MVRLRFIPSDTKPSISDALEGIYDEIFAARIKEADDSTRASFPVSCLTMRTG